MIDLTYSHDGMFTRFYPESKAGETAWHVMAESDGVAAVLRGQAQILIAQLRAAGYKVAKVKPITVNIDDILKELEV